MIVHAGLVAARIQGRWRGALIEGASGTGKSDLALRALDCGMRLVSDDRTLVFVSGGRLYGAAPKTISGFVEVRGVGVVSLPALPTAEIVLRVRCVNSPEAVERSPDAISEKFLSVNIASMELWPIEASAPYKLILALRHLGVSPQQGYQARFAPLAGCAGP
jgi:serine kinase of HPr protein (carbohydrate metabolism regulator)